MEGICVRLKELRKELCMSQVDFAKKLGVTNAHISKIEKGGTVPSEALIKLISKEYNVNEVWLKTGNKPVFISDIEEITEEMLIDSSSTFNKLLHTDSYLIRNFAAELKFEFSNITDVSGLDENQKIKYLSIVKKMFSIIMEYNTLIKEHLNSRQVMLEIVRNNRFDNYKDDMIQCINEYEKLIKNEI